MMNTKFLNLCFILLLVGAQIVLANHSFIHILDNANDIQHEQDEHDESATELLCQLCLSTKLLAFTILPIEAGFNLDIFDRVYEIARINSFIYSRNTQEYLARAPPTLLI